MTESETHGHDEPTSTVPSNESNEERTERLTPEECHETVDQETRDAVLDDYGSRCQVCGRCGPAKGGLASLHVHHIERDPDGMGEHDIENLTLLCRSCHSWFHQQARPADAPVNLTEADRTVLLSQDIEVLQYLAEHGPARTGDIAAEVTADLTVSSVRERLWVLMGLDTRIDDRDRQIVDKDVETNEWGLTDQIETSARGFIPDDQQLLLQRMEDEQVRQALEHGYDRQSVMDVLDISRRSTFNKAKRAYAFDFPLDAFSRGGRPSESTQPDRASTMSDGDTGEEEEQQRLDSVAEQDPDEQGRTETGGTAESNPTTPSAVASEDDDGRIGSDGGIGNGEVRAQLQDVLTALQKVEHKL